MRAPAVAFALAAIAIAEREPAQACSIGYSEEFVDRPPFAPDAELRVRVGHWDGSRRLELWDAQGRPVPSRVEVYTVPEVNPRNDIYAALKPFEPLSPGDYSLGFVRAGVTGEASTVSARAWVFTVRPTASRPAPPAVRRLRVRPVDYECVTGLDHACQAVRESCGFVVLEFEDGPRDERDVYEVRWSLDGRGKDVPARGERVRGFVSERTTRGGGISIPAGWFGNLDKATGRVSIQLRALDDAGNAGPPASASLLAAAIHALPGARRERPRAFLQLDDRYAGDLERLRRAADPSSAAALALMAGGSGGQGPAADRAFADALRTDGDLLIRGAIRGHAQRTSVVIQGEVRGGIVRVPVGPDALGTLVGALPVDIAEVEQIEVWIGGPDSASVRIDIRDVDTLHEGWRFRSPSDLRRKVRQRMALRKRVEADPLFGVLAGALGAPASLQNGRATFGPAGFGQVDAVFESEPARPAMVRITGPLERLREVGPLAPALDAAFAAAAFPRSSLPSVRVEMSIEGETIEGRLVELARGVAPLQGRSALPRP